MAVLRRRGRRQDREQQGPAYGLDLDAVATAVLDAAEAALGTRPGLAHGPEPILGYGPDAYRIRLTTGDPGETGNPGHSSDPGDPGATPGPADPGDPRWAGTLLARMSDPAVLRREAAWLETLRAHGFPATELVTGPTPAADDVLVLRQPPGDSLANVMVANITSVPQFLAAFGQLHGRLHGLPVDGLADGQDDGQADPLDELAARAEPEPVRAAVEHELAWLRAHRPPPDGAPAVACHTELSPAYVYVEGTDTATATAVNWTRARLAEPAWDVAATITAFWSVPIYVDNALHRRGLKMARDTLVSAYLTAYQEAAPAPPDDDRLRYWQAFHVAWLATDVARRIHGVNGPWEPGTLVPQPESTLTEVRARFRELTEASD